MRPTSPTKPRVLGLDVSANRIGVAICDSAECFGSEMWDFKKDGSSGFAGAELAADEILTCFTSTPVDHICLEINDHPKVLHEGRLSPKMVAAYRRSRWVEGALLACLNVTEEPYLLTRKPGAVYKVELEHYAYALPATWSPDAKEKRRRRMSAIYVAYRYIDRMSEDEIDALAIAHDCSVALDLASRGVSL